MIKFDRNKIKPGDKLILVSAPTLPLSFKGMGHGSDVIASYWNPKFKSKADVILRQKDVRMEAQV